MSQEPAARRLSDFVEVLGSEKRIRAILFDMDGVVYNAETPIPGAAETVSWLRERQVPHQFLTNTSSTGRAPLVQKLARFGIPADEAMIMSPPAAAADWLRAQGDGPVALIVKKTAHAEFYGLEILPEDAESGARYVVVGDMEEQWDFRTINRAFRLLHSAPDAQLIALGMTRYWQGPTGLQLDVAPFIAMLECAVQRKAVVFGKPGAAFFQAALNKLGVEKPREALMVGDDIEVDVDGAQQAGLHGALVKTGKFRDSDLDRPVRPYLILDSIADLPAWWRKHCE